MKTHLPHGLRAALMAALASVSLTSGYANADEYGLQFWKDAPSGTPSATLNVNQQSYNYTVGSGSRSLTFKPDANFSRDNVDRLMVSSTNHTGGIYATVQDAPWSYKTDRETYLLGMAQGTVQDGDYYLRSVTKTDHKTGVIIFLDKGCKVTGEAYLGLAGPNTYGRPVLMNKDATVIGDSRLEIAGGTYDGYVLAGIFQGTNSSIGGKSYLDITGGTFNGSFVAAGNYSSSSGGTPTIKGGTVTTITGGTFNTTVYGGSATSGAGTIEKGVTLSITGGTFGANRSVYALGNAGTVNGAVSLTIGNDAKFSGNNVISAGTDGSANYSGVTSSTVTLKDIKYNSENVAWTSNSSITVDGGEQTSDLVLDHVNATIQAQLTRFNSVEVKGNSSVVVSGDNAKLGGATAATVESGSTLTLFNSTAEGRLTITGKGENGATITKDSEATIVDDKDAQLSTGSKIQNAKVEAFGSVALNTELENVDLVSRGSLAVKTPVSGKNTLTVSNGAVVNLIGIDEGKDVVFEKLTIGDKGTLRVFLEGFDIADDYTDHSHTACTMTLGRGTTLVSDGDAKLVGNLQLRAGSILDYSTTNSMMTFAEGYGIGWGSIEEHVSIVLDEWKYARLDGGEEVKLFGTLSDVGTDAYCMLNGALDIYMGSLDGEKMVGKFSVYMSNDSYVLKKTSNVPEPTTGTLSLLALAGLAARRRRKH